ERSDARRSTQRTATRADSRLAHPPVRLGIISYGPLRIDADGSSPGGRVGMEQSPPGPRADPPGARPVPSPSGVEAMIRQRPNHPSTTPLGRVDRDLPDSEILFTPGAASRARFAIRKD